jgi:hypothetical protein
VGGSSISADISAANGKLAQMLRKREEDESLLQIGKRKTKDQAGREEAKRRPGKAGRWGTPADFSHPSPLVDRPRTESGSTSFHFSCTTISKEGSPTVRGEPMNGFGGHNKTPGADHSAYVEREGAAERSIGAEHAAYVEREGAVELAAMMAKIEEDREGRGIGEGLTDDEAGMLGRVEWESVKSVFSNISDDQFEREEYWRAVHRVEREAKMHSLVVDPASNPKWWREIETWPDVPTDFRSHCLVQRDRHEAWLAKEAKDPKGRPFVAEPYTRSAEGCGEALAAATRVPGWSMNDQAVRFESGRGGRVQFRFVAELPHELTPEDRALIVQNFCDHLSTFSKDDAGRPTGMMYTAVIHAPDSHNDRRNFHLHVIAHDRPAKWLPEYRQWDFEVAEEFNHKGQIRIRHPFRQNKIGEVSQGQSKTGRAGSGVDFIPAMRKRFADINNKVLEARGIQRRLDPRRYEEMGIERTPTEHLGTKAAAMEAMGVPTVVGRLNAIAIWTDAEKAIRKRATAVDANLKSAQADHRSFVEDSIAADPRSPETRRLRTLVAEREGLIENVATDRRELMIFDHLEAKAKSRAVRTRQTCLQTLSEAERMPGLHSREVLKLVRKRYDEAQSHIERVDRELAPDRPRIAEAAKDILIREKRIQDIDAQLAPLRAALMAAVERERSTREGRRDRDRRRDRRDRRDASIATETASRDRTATVRQPGSPGAPVINTNDPRKDQNNARDRNAGPSRLALAAGLQFPSREPTDLRVGSLQSSGSLSGVRGLSGRDLVRDGRRPAVLLQGDQQALVGDGGVRSEPGRGDVVRRAGDGDRAAGGEASGAGRRDGLTPPATTIPPVLAPPSVQGVPIIEPTLPVGVDAVTPPSPGTTSVPEGMSPVRDAETTTPGPTEPPVEISIDDPSPIASTDAVGVPDRRTTDPVEPTPTSTTPVAESVPATDADVVPTPGTDRTRSDAEAVVEKVDGRRRVDDPTLFPVERSVGPTKPGTSKATYEEWDGVINRIARERVQVVKEKDVRGRVRYDVPSLDPSEAALLRDDRFAKRTDGRLSALHDQQAREIERLIRWIGKNGRDPAKLVIEGRTAKLGDAPESVRSLMRDWRSHPRVTESLRIENDRRLQAAADAIRDEARRRQEEARRPARVDGPAAASASNQSRLAALADMYPEPSDAATPQVRELVELLRADAPQERIRAAAEAVRSDPFAREDVHRHRVELAQAYNTAIEDSDLERLLMGKPKRGGR